MWCEVGLQLSDIVTKNVKYDGFNPGLVYAMVRLENWQNTFKRGVTGYIRFWRTVCSEWIDSMSLKSSYEFRMMNLSL